MVDLGKPIFRIVHEDNHVLVVEKPPGLLSQADGSEAPDLLTEAKAYLKQKYNKPGNVYLGLVQRLDRNVGGLMILAKTSKAASRLSAAIRNRQVQKSYHALICIQAETLEQEGRLEDWLWKNSKMRTAELFSQQEFPSLPPEKQALCKKAMLDYFIEKIYMHAELSGIAPMHENRFLPLAQKYEISNAEPKEKDNEQLRFALLQIRLHTGRFHQIRAQLAKHLGAIVGDQKYGSRWKISKARLCLHCSELDFVHPVKKTTLRFQSRPPESWTK